MNHKRFSLVELMIVVSIILILAGIGFPIMASILYNAKKATADSQMKLMNVAMESYRSDYQILPFTRTYGGGDILVNTDTGGTGYATLISALSGLGGATPRQGRYLTPDSTGNYRDPWDGDFWVALDLDYDGTVLSGKVYGIGDVSGNYFIWSKGRDGLHNAVDNDPSNDDNLTF